MSKPDPPQPPDPYATAAAQTGTNVSTGVANAFLNNVNQVTPQGNLSYDVSGNYSWTDPVTGQTYNIPRFTATQTQTPAAAAIQAQNDLAKTTLARTGATQAGKVEGILNTPFDPSVGAPAAGDASAISAVPGAATSYDAGGNIQTSLGDYGQQQTTFGDAGDITRSYGPSDNFSADRQRVEESLYGRLNPQLQKERANIEQRLADQGIRYGSQAYTSAMDDYNRQSNDARLAVTAQGGQEQQRMNDMAAKQAGFQNAAQMQAYQQAQGRGEFANEAQSQMYNQALGAGSFANAAQNQQNQQNAGQASFGNAGLAQQLAQQQSGFNAQNAQRNQYMQEQYQQRQQPLNEIAALMTGSQVQNPNWLNTPSSQIQTTDFANIINQNYAQQSQNYQSANQNWQAVMGGLLGAGGKVGAAYLSDRREKDDIARMGTVFAATPEGERKELPIYEYAYKDDPASTKHIGPMAQDVERVDPKAVKNVGGKKYIDPRRVMGGIMRAA